MRRSHVLLLNACGLTAYRCDGKQAVVESQFPAGSSTGFDAYLESRIRDAFALLLDVPDESFEFERLPHVRGRGGIALMRRKREQHSHGSPLCTALLQGRQPDGRQDDRVLFAALTRPQAVDPWLQRLHAAQVPVSGVYSMPLIVADFARDRGAGPFILATIGRGGLRQTFIVDGHLRFSRQTPLPGEAIEEVAAACVTEAANMRRYLGGQRLIERDAALPVLALIHPDQMDDFRRLCRGSPDLRFDCLDLVAEAACRGCMISQSGSCSDGLFSYMLANGPPRRQFASKAIRFHWRLQRLRRAIRLFGWSALVASLLFAAGQLPGALRLREAAAELQARNDAYERTHGREQTETGQEARELALAIAALMRVSTGPEPLLRRLGSAMDAIPAIELESLEWQIATELEHVKGPYAVLEVHGSATEADPGQQRRSVERLAEHLREDHAVETIMLKRPATLVSTQTLRSAEASTADGAFHLRMVQRL